MYTETSILLTFEPDLPYLCGICLVRPAAFQYEITDEVHRELGYVDREGYCCRPCAIRVRRLAQHMPTVAA